MPPDAPFHFPDPALPLSCPFAYAPLIETRTRPPLPMLPETFAPAAEILPSVTVSVELAEGSQLPVFVTMVTFQTPSNGCWARAEVVAEARRPITKKAVPMRLRRMNQVPEL